MPKTDLAPLILQLFTAFTPIITDIIKDYQKSHNGALPTDAEIHTEFLANTNKYLEEGSAWKAKHPQ